MRTVYTSFCLLLGLVIAVVPASAITITTDASYIVDIPGIVTDQDGPNTANSGSVYSYVYFGGGEEDFFEEFDGNGFDEYYPFGSYGDASATASETGNLTGRTYLDMGSDVSEMDFYALSSWSDTVTNTSGGSLDYDFDFFFSGGSLELGQNGGLAMFSLDIFLDGSSIWSRTASLTGSPNGGSVVLDDAGLANTFLQPSPDFVYAEFDPFGGNLDLGNYGNGDSFTLTYNLEVWSSSINQDSYVSARVGDPFGIGFQGAINNPLAPIPEPTTMALLGMGLLGMGARRLGKKS